MNVVFAIILSMLLNAAPLLAADVFIDMDPLAPGIQSELRVVRGSTFTVDVIVTGVDETLPVDVYQLNLEFDPRVLRVVTVTSGGFLSDGFVIQPDITPSEVNWAEGVIGNPGASGDGILITITFEAVHRGTSSLRLPDVILASLGEYVTGALSEGMVTVVRKHKPPHRRNNQFTRAATAIENTIEEVKKDGKPGLVDRLFDRVLELLPRR